MQRLIKTISYNSFVTQNFLRQFSFNGQENDNEVKGTGNSLDFGARIYDPRLGRFLSVDPLYKNFPGQTPYSFANNNPIALIDEMGMSGGKPKSIGYTDAILVKVSSTELQQKLQVRSIASVTGLSMDYALKLVKEEKITTCMYDKDGNKDKGGNATIGIGHKVHAGAIGSNQYDKNATKKEEQFKDGITVDKALDLFVSDLKDRTKEVNNFLKKEGIEVTDPGVKSALVDIYYNAGTEDLKTAMSSYKQGGATGLLETIKNDDISNPSEKRKDMRSDLLKDAVAKETQAKKDEK